MGWGNKPIFSKNQRDIHVDFYNALGDNRFGLFWAYNEPTIFLKDLDLIKRVQVTDFDHFMTFGFSPDNDKKRNEFGLADLKGEDWRRMKKQLTPSFSTPRLKKNISTMNEMAEKLVGYLHSQENKEYVEILDWSKKYYCSCLAAIGFGLNIDCFGEKKSQFERNAGEVFNITNFIIVELAPKLYNLLGLSIINKKFNKYMEKLIKDVVAQRKKQNLQYNDMLNNLIEVSKVNPDMTEEIMSKTAVQFFSDGYESASLVLGILGYHLTVYPDVQAKLQDEIDDLFESKDDGEEITSEDVTNMTYLDQVITEGQRLSPLGMTGRVCTKDWKVPGDDFVIPKGTRVIIPISALHFDEKHWPEPNKFDPERFSSENKSKINSITLQTFGAGPRQCLGMNLYTVETKIMIIHLLRHFKYLSQIFFFNC